MNETREVKLNVPYHSQFLEVEDYFWNIRSCGGTCIKMVLDYYLQEKRIDAESPNILNIMNEAFNSRGYDPNNGFVHDFAVSYFKKYGLESYRKEGSENLDEIIISIDNKNPIVVSITKHTLEQNKFHLILVVGYKYTEDVNGQKITNIIYHEPESTSPDRGAYRDCDIDTFLKDWRGKAIFVSK